MLERASIAIGGVIVSYLSGGRGAARSALVFLHGWRSEAALWQPVMERLIADGHAVYAPDLPGFGKSENPPRAFSVGDYADSVSAFMEKLDVPKAVIVGHSFGGRIGIVLSATEPDLVSKLVLVDAAGIRNPSSHRMAAAFFAKIVKPLFSPRFMQPARRALYRMLGAYDYLATPALTETFQRVIAEDLSPLLPSIRQETLLIWGENDADTPLASARKMETEIPQATLTVIPGAGHFSFLDDPEAFYSALAPFVA